MVVSKGDYNEALVAAAHAVMVELGHLLGEFREKVIVIGGWVPALLLGQSREPHIGSIDVDLALDHRALRDPTSASRRS